MSDDKKPKPKDTPLPEVKITGRPIFTWQCQHCGWANDNNNGPCRKCGKD